ncbi:MAG: HEAT repeat domain-containing protein [Anaerolineales bacterium]|uniref:HEAT repeat domain-containing protein n=1 Tax=Candidatus Desulfolinea nitratireducens TaxID=2841698 RepID=A0A8J6NIY1_9CHLR|nr:HEAT repeat domain-containing protein [Candidatus Desulfolinea nitratireducens]MBL6960361.1 HEAT repeat domain-containing protein [Anaerolineales bacterium]
MTSPEPSFQDAVDLLTDENQEFSRDILFQFSDIDPGQLKTLLDAWPQITLSRKQLLLASLRKELNRDVLLCYDMLAMALLKDEDVIIRTTAIRLLSDCESEDLVPIFLEITKNDPETAPRAEAITALGAYVLRGELDEIFKESLKEIENVLLQISRSGEKTELRQRALESLGYSSHEEIPALIKDAWEREAPMWKASAVFAMGRSCDLIWEENILEGLVDDNEIIRLAATKAAGEIALASARPLLLKNLAEEEDDDVFQALIWSLSQIGGEDVREFLLSLFDRYEDEEEEQIEYLEEALANLDFTEDTQGFDILSFNADDDILDI